MCTVGYDDDGVSRSGGRSSRKACWSDLQTNRETAHYIGQNFSRGCTFATSWRNYPFLRMPNVHVEPGPPGSPTPEQIIADTKDGILIDGRGSYSIDQQRFNGQFGGDAFWEIKDGKKTRMLSDVTYNAITTDFWQNLDATSGKESWEMHGTTGTRRGSRCRSIIPRTARRGCASAGSWLARPTASGRPARSEATRMQLITQPDDGVAPLIKAIKRAKKTVDIVIFRFDIEAIEEALTAAVERGVAVRALIAHTNRGGESKLRKLESRLLKAGVTLSRTADDMVRYHGKLLVIDGRRAFVLGFNYTHQDIEKSRSFGLVTRNPKIVRDIMKVIDADHNRVDLKITSSRVVVSPENARERLAAFIGRARQGTADLRRRPDRRQDRSRC